MSMDRIERGLAALRAEGELVEDEATRDAALGRILVSMQGGRRRRRAAVAGSVSLAVLFAASSAWAAVTGRLPELVDVARGWVTPAEHAGSTPRRRSTPHERSERTAQPSRLVEHEHVEPHVEPAAIDEEPNEAGLAPVAAENRAVRAELSPVRAARSPTAPSAPRAPAPSSTPADRGLALYATAHEAHFHDGDMTRAVAAWDAYLAFAPRGTLAPEARFNRGVALARLGRTREARDALTPFAEGAFGDYRREDAAILLEHLDP